ncbi:MAG: flagellar biosynthetic protein FliO [Candidatus Gastranaerophilales bacterium]|nr:flagellar biosynthetic protein FliO [Candidatus Gastranaerophilales bacterium]
MNSYLINFTVYTFAMIGFIALALFVYKKSMYSASVSKDKDFLKVENSLRLSAAKTIYVLKAGDEKFLIAGDAANTTMLAKLNNTLAADKTSFPIKEKTSGISIIKQQMQRISRG